MGELTDVSTRLDGIQNYQANLEGQGSKPTWAVIQAFGDQDYWTSIPSVAEVENMMMLAVDHNAKGFRIGYIQAQPTSTLGVDNLERSFRKSLELISCLERMRPKVYLWLGRP